MCVCPQQASVMSMSCGHSNLVTPVHTGKTLRKALSISHSEHSDSSKATPKGLRKDLQDRSHKVAVSLSILKRVSNLIGTDNDESQHGAESEGAKKEKREELDGDTGSHVEVVMHHVKVRCHVRANCFEARAWA